MHELGITHQIVEAVTSQSGGAKITRIRVEIGKLSGVMADAVRFCFDACASGTLAEGATLEIIELPGLAWCLECAKEVSLDEPYGRCSCGNVLLQWISGHELKLKDMEVV